MSDYPLEVPHVFCDITGGIVLKIASLTELIMLTVQLCFVWFQHSDNERVRSMLGEVYW